MWTNKERFFHSKTPNIDRVKFYILFTIGCDFDNIISTPNTDNKGNLFVTVFAFVPAPMTIFECLYRDPASAHNQNPAW